MSPSRLANYSMYWRLSLISCAVVQGTFWAEGCVPQETRDTMEELCCSMQILIIEHLTSASRSTGIIWQTADAVRYAIHFAYTYLNKSRPTSEDVAECCKPYLLKCLSSLGLSIENIILMQIYCTYAT